MYPSEKNRPHDEEDEKKVKLPVEVYPLDHIVAPTMREYTPEQMKKMNKNRNDMDKLFS